MTNRVLAPHHFRWVQLVLGLAIITPVPAATPPDPAAPLVATAPALSLRHTGLNRGVPVAGESAEIGAVVRNCGREPWPAGAARLQMWMSGQPWPAASDGFGPPHGSTGIPLPVPALQPGEQRWIGTWFLPRAGTWPVEARLTTPTGQPLAQQTAVVQVHTRRWRATLRNDRIQIQFFWGNDEPGFATIRTRGDTPDRRQMAVLPLGHVVLATPSGPKTWHIPFDRWVPETIADPAAPCGTVRAEGVPDPDGVPWDVSIRFALDPDQPLARLLYTWTPRATRRVLELTGPDLVVGDGSPGSPESWARLPESARQTANDEAGRLPDPHHVEDFWAEPVMAVTVGPRGSATAHHVAFALSWNPTSADVKQSAQTRPRFTGPRPVEGRPYHRLGLAVSAGPPSAGNPEAAGHTWTLEAGTPVRLDATVIVTTEPLPERVRY